MKRQKCNSMYYHRYSLFSPLCFIIIIFIILFASTVSVCQTIEVNENHNRYLASVKKELKEAVDLINSMYQRYLEVYKSESSSEENKIEADDLKKDIQFVFRARLKKPYDNLMELGKSYNLANNDDIETIQKAVKEVEKWKNDFESGKNEIDFPTVNLPPLETSIFSFDTNVIVALTLVVLGVLLNVVGWVRTLNAKKRTKHKPKENRKAAKLGKKATSNVGISANQTSTIKSNDKKKAKDKKKANKKAPAPSKILSKAESTVMGDKQKKKNKKDDKLRKGSKNNVKSTLNHKKAKKLAKESKNKSVISGITSRMSSNVDTENEDDVEE